MTPTMERFGVRFAFGDADRFEQLARLVDAVREDKAADEPRPPEDWKAFVPDEVKAGFRWPHDEERAAWLAVRARTPIAIGLPAEQLGSSWNFYAVFEAFDSGEYDVLGCERVADGIGEIVIDPHAYPYGGLGPFIALAEAFGFEVLGVNECGRWESREELRG